MSILASKKTQKVSGEKNANVRYSSRKIRQFLPYPPVRYTANLVKCDIKLPKIFYETLRRTGSDYWKNAMNEEIESLHRYDT